MKKGKENKNQQLSDFLDFSAKLTDEEKKLQAAAMAGFTEEINIDKAFNNVILRTRKNLKPKKFFNQLTKVAAVLAIPLLIFSAWNIYQQISSQRTIDQLAMQEFTSPTGMRSHVILPDGTKVWLNAESKIQYTVPFVRKNRKVDIEGEAFLKVSHNKKSPFIVTAANTQIEVTGTAFNIKAYPNENTISVALQEGSVNLKASDGNQTLMAQMFAGDFFEVEKGTNEIKSRNLIVDKQIAWHNNILVLDETPLEEVAVLLERWYGVKVFITDDELKKYKFSTTFENEPLNRVLELLELSSPNLKFTYKPGKLNLNPGERNYSTVTISKK